MENSISEYSITFLSQGGCLMTQTNFGSTPVRRMNSGLRRKCPRLFSVAVALVFLAPFVLYKLFTIHLALYRPVESVIKPDGWSTDSWEFVHVDINLSRTQANRICKTLRYYNEFHFRIFNYVFISRQLYNDSELLWNYTNKSQILDLGGG